VTNAKRQYCEDRDERDLLLSFKLRTLVHFAVDPDEVWMTTRLKGKETLFLPFNKGCNHGAGNPPVAGNWKTHYLWDEVLAADSLMDILQRFVHLEVKERSITTSKGTRTVRKESMIFPRYHQLDAVRRLVDHARANGSGHNYLVQHSAGSGKSNTIAWLAHRLASLHDENDEKVFHSVVVVTDRRVLDQQLQNTIYQFEHKTGVVEKIDEDTQQLARALSSGTPIVITTIQKFPFITQAISTLEKHGKGVKIDTAGKRFAVIVDEAHSSQSGETANTLRGMLNQDGIEAAVAAQLSDEEDGDLSEEAKAKILRDALQRKRQPNLSFFAFTAPPKFKTKAIFDEPGPSGVSPFHEYTMRQAIEEGFIMDVLKNYTTYKRFFGLVKQVEDDPEVPRNKAAKVLTRYMELHPVNIGQVVSVIIEHFRLYVLHELGGRAKAMVVTGSRLAAVKYKLASINTYRITATRDPVPRGFLRHGGGSRPSGIVLHRGCHEQRVGGKRASRTFRRRRLPRASRRGQIPDGFRSAAPPDDVCGQASRRRAGRADAFAPEPYRTRKDAHLCPRFRQRRGRDLQGVQALLREYADGGCG
jgi:type I restriction enzyme R subunit